MLFEENAHQIRKQGEKLLVAKRIVEKLEQRGTIFFSGSYALDLMTWHDIDLQLVVKAGLDPLETLSYFYLEMAKDPDFIEGKIINFTGNHKPKMPRGVYLGIDFHSAEHGGFWKLDIWSLFPKDLEANQILLEQLKQKLTPFSRQLILEMKHFLMKSSGRVPQMGSHFLYQAILLEGLSDKQAILDYLLKHGVKC